MKILVVSDTHGSTERLLSLVGDVRGGIAALIHAGDGESEAAEVMRQYPDLPVYAVSGNCDYARLLPQVKLAEVGGKRIYITHGHRLDVGYSVTRLMYTALENKADICVFGHTHVPFFEKHDGLCILNPGSLSRPRGGSEAGYAVIDIENNGEVNVKFVKYR